jgi:O-antigen/teichoic acid export membrane protein
MSRVRFASRNYLSAVLSTVLAAGAGFVATPWLLRWLGTERFGAYRVTLDWYGYLSFAELGLGGALLPLLARALGKGQQDEVHDLLAASIRAYLGVTGAMLLAGLLLVAFINRLIVVSPQNVHDLRLGCLLGLASLFWLPLAAPFRALTDARQRSYWISVLLTMESLLATGTGLLLAWRNWGITGQFVAFLVAGSAFNGVLIWAGVQRYPGVLARALTGKYDKSATGELWKLNVPTYVVYMCARVSLLTDNIVVAAILGPVMVVPLILTQRLAAVAQGQLQGISAASWAGLAELYSRGERDTFQRRVVELTSVNCVLAIACLVPIAVFNCTFVSMWVGASRFGGQRMTLFAVMNAFLSSLLSLWGWVFIGTGAVRRIVRPLLLQTLFNFAASVLLTKPLGAVGPLIGTLIGFTVVTAWYLPVQLHRTFGISARKLVAAVAKPVVLGVPYVIGLWLFERTHHPSGWIALAGEMLLAALLYLALAWWLVLTPDDRKMWRERTGLWKSSPGSVL